MQPPCFQGLSFLPQTKHKQNPYKTTPPFNNVSVISQFLGDPTGRVFPLSLQELGVRHERPWERGSQLIELF